MEEKFSSGRLPVVTVTPWGVPSERSDRRSDALSKISNSSVNARTGDASQQPTERKRQPSLQDGKKSAMRGRAAHPRGLGFKAIINHRL